MFDSGDSVLGFIGSTPPRLNTAIWVDAKKLDFGLIWHNTFTQFSSESLPNFRRARTCAFLSRGTLLVLQDFLVTMVTVALRSLTRSSRVVLGWFLTVLMIIETRLGEVLHGAPVLGRLTSHQSHQLLSPSLQAAWQWSCSPFLV